MRRYWFENANSNPPHPYSTPPIWGDRVGIFAKFWYPEKPEGFLLRYLLNYNHRWPAQIGSQLWQPVVSHSY